MSCRYDAVAGDDLSAANIDLGSSQVNPVSVPWIFTVGLG